MPFSGRSPDLPLWAFIKLTVKVDPVLIRIIPI